MNDLSAPEVVGISAVAVIAMKMAFDAVMKARGRNGHGKTDSGVISLSNAPEFALMQRQMLANDEDAKRWRERMEQMIRDIHEEVLDDQVSRHHRRTPED